MQKTQVVVDVRDIVMAAAQTLVLNIVMAAV